MEDKRYKVWLYSLPGVGSARFTALVNHFETAKNVFESSKEDLVKCKKINRTLADVIVSNRNIEKIDRYLKKVKENDIKVYTIDEAHYPENLKNIYDPPAVIYVKGELKPEDHLAIGIVGSRKASEYGLKTAERMAEDMAREGICIVSGMALGIDSAAHRGALKAKGRTVAVLGCGVNKIYPASAASLYRDIIKNGAVISEYPIGTDAIPENFPARNRIISGMSKGILVIEAGLKSGSLITSDFALEQGRDVFAIPGNINANNSRGTNNLIKMGAKLVDSAEDILEELQDFSYEAYTTNKASAQSKSDKIQGLELSKLEKQIVACLSDIGSELNAVIEKTGYASADILSAMTILEIKGVIQQMDGKYYIY